MITDIELIEIQPDWGKKECLSCGETVFIDEKGKRIFHKEPPCAWFTKCFSHGECVKESAGECEKCVLESRKSLN